MKNRKPDFYDSFTCIADRCDFTCCQQWKINVDDATHLRWKKTAPPGDTAILQGNLAKYTRKVDGARVIALDERGKCPFLNDEKLCKLVIKHGDAMIPHACQIFPREKHEFEDIEEYTLMPCCPAVVDMLNDAKHFATVTEGDMSECEADFQHDVFDINYLMKIRQYFVELVQDEEFSLSEALLTIYYILHEEIPLEQHENHGFARTFLSKLREVKLDMVNTVAECNELFLDLIENYRAQGLYTSYLQPLWEIAEHIEDDDELLMKHIDGFTEAFGRYDALFRKVMAEELYADLLLPDGNWNSMTIKMQWLEMQFVFMRHICYLKYYRTCELSYQDVRDAIVLSSRMMGYEEDDIYEYLENSFEDIMWEWGYYFLLMGM